MAWYHESKGLSDWSTSMHERIVRSNGAEPNAGRRLHVWTRLAGIGPTGMTAIASTWYYYTPEEERSWWSGLWAERVVATQNCGIRLTGPLCCMGRLSVAFDRHTHLLDQEGIQSASTLTVNATRCGGSVLHMRTLWLNSNSRGKSSPRRAVSALRIRPSLGRKWQVIDAEIVFPSGRSSCPVTTHLRLMTFWHQFARSRRMYCCLFNGETQVAQQSMTR
ncbi:hypothetical protein JB92DRAFT_2855975 [Gautieria morchelliformis]|nr:hypothetical protein JB92DRAFT_2855975 [Gautieria morchelliformis]